MRAMENYTGGDTRNRIIPACPSSKEKHRLARNLSKRGSLASEDFVERTKTPGADREEGRKSVHPINMFSEHTLFKGFGEEDNHETNR